ncbi:M15 family metallopeptidase [Floricoccus penangensis]|uniref:M15 family metallopeptidase n=1 Tax=Floricoccus penangensis TaxID=1859475 RepID=UPI0013011C53|nr:M15 family metallopeptidase [Floricoccus penangensis]
MLGNKSSDSDFSQKTTQSSEKNSESSGENESNTNTSKDDWKLILVNKKNVLDYEVSFNQVSMTEGKSIIVDERIEEALQSYVDGAKSAGYDIQYVSGYRSRADQQVVYNTSLQQNIANGLSKKQAEEATESLINPPGASEHMTGLAVDIAGSDALAAYPQLEGDMDKYESQQWLIKHAQDYGFILRYPKDPKSIEQTMIDYESWHFRYVGKDIAKYITEKGITLEEYLDKLLNKEQ